MQVRYSLALVALLGAPAFAGGLSVNIEVPRLNVAEYHRPYVAAWIERPDQSVATTLAVWYDVKNKGNAEGEGTKWLKDLRQWWRRTGRELQMPVDGVSSATRPAGKHQLAFTEGSAQMPKLAPGAYKLHVEAAREVGGREIVGIPFQWPPAKADTATVAGTSELGEIKLDLAP
ncbi:DUF2271 domain-containing protein [Variovorax sp. YR216]|uniref:DUF2271 domain-containing protein n=1 Tax=Variovorax sp. YR216 TaxID=1882828 RepID=UPI00089D185C|nr:DUF2271 domain-containing protein [Variovorax sp. YR216]SEB19095.1 Hypothetical protein SAMN05444680_112119 [Variovorax sp. YR216]